VKASGREIEYDLQDEELWVTSEAPHSLANLKVPFQGEEIEEAKSSFMIIEARRIHNKRISPEESLLVAIRDDAPVHLTYGDKKAWAKQVFIRQNEAAVNRQKDFLLLVDEAKLVDVQEEQTLISDMIKVNLGNRALHAGLLGRASGRIPLERETKKGQEQAPAT
jgi:hypothetical protein